MTTGIYRDIWLHFADSHKLLKDSQVFLSLVTPRPSLRPHQQQHFLLFSECLNCKLAHNGRLNWTRTDWRADGLKADGSCLAPLAVIFGRCHFEAIRGGQAHLATNPRSRCLLLSLSLCPSTKWGQQSSEQIGLLLNCLVNGYNDTINCMSAAQLALKSGTRPSPTLPPASLTPTSHTGYMPCPFAAAAANMNYFFWQNLICLK